MTQEKEPMTTLAFVDWLGLFCSNLTDMERRVLWLTARGKTPAEIATELETSVGSIKTLQYKGKQKLSAMVKRMTQ